MSVLLNTQATSVTIKRGKKLGFALPLNTEYQSLKNLKRFRVSITYQQNMYIEENK